MEIVYIKAYISVNWKHQFGKELSLSYMCVSWQFMNL